MNKIPVMGHIGITPQTIRGKYRYKGKTNLEKKKLIKDSKSLEEAGVFAIVLECVERKLSKQITENNITIEKKKYYLDILIRMLDNKKLNKKSEIIYDENNGYIVNIPIFKSLIS